MNKRMAALCLAAAAAFAQDPGELIAVAQSAAGVTNTGGDLHLAGGGGAFERTGSGHAKCAFGTLAKHLVR